MADNTENTGMSNFSIQDTMSMTSGNQELIQDLFNMDADPNDITPIITEVPPSPATPPATPPPAAPAAPAVPAAVDPKKSITDFLEQGGEDDDEEEEVITPTGGTTPGAPADPSDGGETVDNSQFSALSRDLFTLGVFTTPEGEQETPITSPEEFLERFNAEKQRGSIEMVNNFIGQFGEDYQEAFNAVFVNGVNPRDYFTAMNTVEDYSALDMTSEDNQRLVLRQALQEQGFDPEDITAEIEKLTNYGDLATTAERHHKVLIKKQAAKLQELQQNSVTELQRKAAIRNQYVTNVQNIIRDKVKEKTFDGIPLNPKLATELHDFLIVDKYKTPSGETLTDFDRTILDLKKPENHATKVKVALLLKILEKDPTLSTIQKTGITNKSNGMFAEVTRQTQGQKSSPQQQKGAAPSWFK